MYTLSAERDGCSNKHFGEFVDRAAVERYIAKMDHIVLKNNPNGQWLEGWDLLITEKTTKRVWVYIDTDEWEELEMA